VAREFTDKRLRALDAAQWHAACPNLAILAFRDGDAIYHQGVRSDAVYYLVSGHVKLSVVGAEGTERTIAILGSGELLGPGISGPKEMLAAETAYAKGDVQVYRFPRHDLVELVISHATHAQAVLDLLARRHYVAVRRLNALHFKTAEARVAEALLDLIRNDGGFCGHGYQLEIPLTQQELAELASASRPVVSTILNRLRKQGVLSYTRTFICIDDMDALARISESA